jgi:hypothetical protein
MEVLMKRFQLVTIAVVVMLLMLSCATIGGRENNNNNDQNQPNQEQNTNTQEDQTDEGDNSNQEDTAGDNNNEKDKNEESDTPPTTGGDLDGSLWETEFGKLLESGSLVMESNQSNSDGETVGTILTIWFTNTTADEILVTVPCGLVFIPTTTDEQALMMVQPLEVSLAAGESAEYTPFVVCIEVNAPAPAFNSGYTIGYLAEEDLLAFAECICGEQLVVESMDSVGVQFAAWSIATQGDFLSLATEEGAAFEDFMEGMDLDEFGEMITEMMSMFGGEWLDRCGITVGEE